MFRPMRVASERFGAAAVVHAPRVEEHRAARHLRRLGVVGGEGQLVLAVVAARHDPGGPVLLGEVGQGPDGVALDLVARREGEEVERPLVPVDGLGASRPGPMAMAWVRCSWMFVAWPRKVRAVPSASGCMTSSRHAGDRAMSEPVRRVRLPLKLVGPGRRRVEVGTQLGLDAVEQRRRRHPVDDDRAVPPDGRRHLVGAARRWPGGRWARPILHNRPPGGNS